MAKNAPRINWADFAYSGSMLLGGIFCAIEQFFAGMASNFALHSVAIDQDRDASKRRKRFAEEAGIDIERITRGA